MDYGFISRDGSVPDIESLFKSGTVAFDIESTGTHNHSDVPLGYSICNSAGSAYYTDIDDRELLHIFSDPNRLYIAHNAKFDRTKLKQVGVEVNNICDTMIAAHLMEEPMLSLDELILAKTGRYITKFSDLKRPLIDMTNQEIAESLASHSLAAWILWHGYEDDKYLWEGYEKELRRNLVSDVFWNLEMPLVPVLSDMESNGMMVDEDYLRELGNYFDSKLEILDDAMRYWSNEPTANFNSPEQVADIFYNKLKIKHSWKKTKSTGRYVVDGKFLETIKHTHPVLPYYLMYKQFRTLKSTYVEGLLRNMIDGRVYGSFKQQGTRTSRLSSADPNLQNIPQRRAEGRKIRRAFKVPDDCVMVKADADQLELKMGGIQSKDPYMLEAFRQKRDIHLETALRAFKDPKRRPDGKTLNFKNQYGGGTDEEKRLFYGAYPILEKWTNKMHQEVTDIGYVRTMMGRKRTIPEAQSPNQKMMEHGWREAISTLIQGSSAEVVKVGMIRVGNDIRNTDIKMTSQVHDEMVFQVPKKVAKDFIQYIGPRIQYDELDIPITYSVSYGKNWAEMTKYSPGDEINLN